MTTAYGPLRGFVSTVNHTAAGPVGTIVDISGTEYFLTPQNWLADNAPSIGDIVEFSARSTKKGYMANNIMPATVDSLCPPGFNATKMDMVDADRRAERARRYINRLRQFVLEDEMSPELAIIELFELDMPVGVQIPDVPDERDLEYFEQLAHNRAPKPNHPTNRRLCRVFMLAQPALVGLMRGSISYRTALARTELVRKKTQRDGQEQPPHTEDQHNEHEDSTATALISGIASRIMSKLKS